jgi:hypothetical protein
LISGFHCDVDEICGNCLPTRMKIGQKIINQQFYCPEQNVQIAGTAYYICCKNKNNFNINISYK